MELRQYLVVLRRHKWLILQAVVIVAAVAAGLSTLQEPSYRATARVLLHPNDPAEHLYSENAPPRLVTDPDRYISGQIDVIESESVRSEASRLLGAEVPPGVLMSAVSVSQDGNSDVLEISATDTSPRRAARMADAVAQAYIENRRLRTVQGLDRAVGEAQHKLAELEKRMADLDAQLASLGPAGQPSAPPPARTADDKPVTRDSLLAARQATSDQYQSLYARQQELVVNKSLKQGEAEIVSRAKAPSVPSAPDPWRNAIMGAVGGLLLGLAAAFLREQLDERLRSREEVERANGLPVLAEIPLDGEAGNSAGVVTIERPVGSVAEAVRSLRSSLLFLDADHSAKRLVVTSPGPAEGKSFVAANLASAYAQAGFSTVLVSGDLRRPRLESLFGAQTTPGLSDVISEVSSSRWSLETFARAGATANGNARNRSPVVSGGNVRSVWVRRAVEGALVETELPGLRLFPAGSSTPNPAELLGSLPAGVVFDELAELADVVLFDTPPVLAVTDATILAAKADGVIVVNALGQTQRGAAKRSKETLENVGARVLGVVVNKVRASSDSYFYYSGYYGADRDDDAARRSRRRRRRGRSGEGRRREAAKVNAR